MVYGPPFVLWPWALQMLGVDLRQRSFPEALDASRMHLNLLGIHTLYLAFSCNHLMSIYVQVVYSRGHRLVSLLLLFSEDSSGCK